MQNFASAETDGLSNNDGLCYYLVTYPLTPVWCNSTAVTVDNFLVM